MLFGVQWEPVVPLLQAMTGVVLGLSPFGTLRALCMAGNRMRPFVLLGGASMGHWRERPWPFQGITCLPLSPWRSVFLPAMSWGACAFCISSRSSLRYPHRCGQVGDGQSELMNQHMLSKVSTVVLTYNGEINLPACLESLTLLNGEVIVLDSGSTDNTLDMAERCGAKESTVMNREPGIRARRRSIGYLTPFPCKATGSSDLMPMNGCPPGWHVNLRILLLVERRTVRGLTLSVACISWGTGYDMAAGIRCDF